MGGDGVDERGARGAQGGGGRGGPRGHDPHVGGEGARGEEAAPAAARRSLRAVVPHQSTATRTRYQLLLLLGWSSDAEPTGGLGWKLDRPNLDGSGCLTRGGGSRMDRI